MSAPYNRHNVFIVKALRFFVSLATRQAVHMGEENEGGGVSGRPEIAVMARPKAKPQKPAMYHVLLLNDDFTPMDFVVHILERFFGKNRLEATEIMMQVHRRGVGICGVYTYEVAETKVKLVMDYARKHEHPLQCTMEKA